MKNLILSALLIVTGCATGSHVITGRARPMTSPDAVKVYSAKPENAEVLGSVSVREPNGFSHMAGGTMIKVLKEEAAKMGANGLVVGSSELHLGKDYQTDGIAIYVP